VLGEGRAADRVLVRQVAQPQLDRVDRQRVRQLVHRALQRERADRLAGRAHVGVGHHRHIDMALKDFEALRAIGGARA
jgi:hypothetical protein